MNRGLNRLVTTALSIAALSLGLQAQIPAETFDKVYRLDATRPMILEFHDVDGRLRLSPSPDATVSVKVTKETKTRDIKRAERLLRDTKVEVEQRGNTLMVRIRYPRFRGIFFWLGDYDRVRVSSEITVPAGALVKASVVDGAIVGEDMRGEFELSVVDGDIRLDRIAGDLKASATDGTIDIAGDFRSLSLRSIDGDITVHPSAASVMATDWDIRTVDGDVEAVLPSGFAAEVKIQTNDGRLDSDYPASPLKRSGRKHYAFTIGSGGKTFDIRTTDGDITLRKR
jgi:hypothetical protein